MVIILFIFKDLLVLYNINMLHLDYLMISNGGCDPFHYIKGNGGLGYKPSAHFMHGLGYSHDWMDGSGFISYKNKFNTSHDFPKDQSHTLDEISKLSGYSKKGLQTIYNKGIGAYHTNPQSVRPQVKSPEQWAMARVYAAINPKSGAHKVDKSHLKGLGFDKEFPEINEIISEENPVAIKDLLLKDFNPIEDIAFDNSRDIIKETNQINDWLEFYDNLTKKERFNYLTEEDKIKLKEKAEAILEYRKYVDYLKENAFEGEEKAKKQFKKKFTKPFFDTTVNEMLTQDPFDGYNYFQNQKKLHPDETKNEPNGIAWEKVQNEPENKKAVSRYTGDKSNVRLFSSELQDILEPTDEYVEKLLKRLNKNDLLPSQTIPFDSYNDKYFIEKKNYIHTKNSLGENLDLKEMKNVFNLHREGYSPEEIEKKYLIEGRKLPNILITKGKLTGLDVKGNRAPMYATFDTDKNGERFVSAIKLHKNFIAENGEPKYIPMNKPITIWEGNRGLIYDLLLDNTRVFYDPLKDPNLKLKNDGSFDTSHYKTTTSNNEEFIEVPLTRVNMSKIRKIKK